MKDSCLVALIGEFFISIQSRMSAVQRWATNDTLRSNNYLHNCPFCRCQKDAPPSLYLHPWSQQTKDHANIQTHHFAMTFPSRQSNVVFSYRSPIKLERYHSAEARFSTKRYKNKHFPQIGRISESEAPIVYVKAHPSKVNKVKISAEVCRPAFREGDGHDSQRILTKKVEQYNRGGSDSQNCNGQNLPIAQQSSSDLKATPIQYLKQFSKKEQLKPKDQEILNSEEPTHKQINISANKRYPTIKSIDIFEHRHNRPEYPPSSQSQTSLRAFERGGRQTKQLIHKSDEDNELIGSSIAQELQLNYDYYFPTEQTDQSLSGGVQF